MPRFAPIACARLRQLQPAQRMTDIPKSLATRHLTNPDLAKAAQEAHNNATRLLLGGYFDAARRIVVALLSPGQWRLAATSHLAYATWQKLYWLDAQLPRDRPALDESPEGAADYLEWSMPRSEPLLQLAQRGKLLNRAAGEDDVAALEARLGSNLPPSYREFLLTSDGLVVPTFGVSLLPAAQVDWFRNLDEVGTIEIWNESDDEATDAQDAIYGADQDCVHMRPRHLRTALQISTSADGDVLLLIPEVRFGAEWEAWFFGNKNPGAYRYRSFRALMQQCVLATEP